MPAFTDHEAAEVFAKLYVAKVRRVIPFEVISLSGKILAKHLSDDRTIVLNPFNGSEYRLTEEDVESIKHKIA